MSHCGNYPLEFSYPGGDPAFWVGRAWEGLSLLLQVLPRGLYVVPKMAQEQLVWMLSQREGVSQQKRL